MPDGNRMLVPCGKCIICSENKQREWAVRNFFELKDAATARFLTLTYDDEHLPRDFKGVPYLDKRDIQKFFKRFRHSYTFRYFGCGEYGLTTARPHFHIIFYFPDPVDNDSRLYDDVVSSWRNGKIMMSEVNDNRVYYCAKYCVKSAFMNLMRDVYDDNYELFEKFSYLYKYHPPFCLSSRRPPIGHRILNQREILSGLLRPYVVYNGFKYSLPRLFRDKIFSDSEKEHLRSMLPPDYYDTDYEIDVREIYKEKVRFLKQKVKQEFL